MSDETERKPAELIAEWMNTYGITIESVFIPWSKSRNAPNRMGKDERARKGWRSLNWEITIKRAGRHVLTTEYSAGEAHAPAYKRYKLGATRQLNTPEHAALDAELETGIVHVKGNWGLHDPKADFESYNNEFGDASRRRKRINPAAADVLASLALDSSVLDSGTFEDWAAEYGYDADSREAEKTYRQCLEIALKLRAAIGDDGLQALRNACQDY